MSLQGRVATVVGGQRSRSACFTTKVSYRARLRTHGLGPSADGGDRQLAGTLKQSQTDHPNQVDGHPEALRILVRNLLDNAVKYPPSGGMIDLPICRVADGLVLSVEDSGPGITESDHERVLDRFSRVAGTESIRSGLGLAIVKAIAELHGATVALDRSPKMGGLRVLVSFPKR